MGLGRLYNYHVGILKRERWYSEQCWKCWKNETILGKPKCMVPGPISPICSLKTSSTFFCSLGPASPLGNCEASTCLTWCCFPLLQHSHHQGGLEPFHYSNTPGCLPLTSSSLPAPVTRLYYLLLICSSPQLSLVLLYGFLSLFCVPALCVFLDLDILFR